MKHGTVTKAEPFYRFPDLPDMRHWFDALPTWFTPFETLKVEQFMADDMFVVRAEMPGIDPDKDAEIWIADGTLHMKVERTMEEHKEEEGTFRTEFGYGSFHRAVALPKGFVGDDVKATYKDGVLEVKLPVRAATAPVAKVPIAKG
jgi:HSP20 family protein